MSSAFGEICRRIRENRISELRIENEKLERQVETLKHELINVRKSNGIPHVSVY